MAWIVIKMEFHTCVKPRIKGPVYIFSCIPLVIIIIQHTAVLVFPLLLKYIRLMVLE